MSDFQSMFTESRGEPVMYNGRLIHMVDKISVGNKQKAIITFQQANSDWRQGIHLSTVGSFDVGGQKIKTSIVLWKDTAPEEVELIIQSKNGVCLVKNVWDVGDGVMHSWHGGGAMSISDLGNDRIYECNDGRADDDFDDLVFRISLVG
jgi:hypothetical protein